MFKFVFASVLAASVLVFVSCSNDWIDTPQPQLEKPASLAISNSSGSKAYGAYIAGRVAHLRKDFNTASDYYIKSLEKDPTGNKELVSRLYLLLVSEGRIDEAAKYAQIAQKNGDKNNFIDVIVNVENIKKRRYKDVYDNTHKLKNPIYDEFINPLIVAWAYAGDNKKTEALKMLDTLNKEPSFKALYHFQAGMINDYFNDTPAAQKHYEVIVNDEQLDMSFRALQIICNFYIRKEKKDKAIALVSRYSDEKLLGDMLDKLTQNVKNAHVNNTKPILTDPNIGLAESLFSIAATLHQGDAGIDLAHMFISMSIYANPNYDLAKLMLADILESRDMYTAANEVYDSIPKESETYYSVQLKKANNYITMEDYEAAEILLKSMAYDVETYQVYLDLADVLRMQKKNEEAIKYYKQALKKLDPKDETQWPLYYALGIAYEQDGQWNKAEKSFKKALVLSQNHYLVLNYLGYTWIKQNKNIDQAFMMIVSAYNQSPNDGNVMDSLGLALYKLGYYGMAINYLEKAAQTEPSNAIISDHLGDAYWFGKRKNEARFQWKHALTMKDSTGELDISLVKDKLANGLSKAPELSYNKEIIEEQIKLINKD